LVGRCLDPCISQAEPGNDTRSVLGMRRWGCSTEHATCGQLRRQLIARMGTEHTLDHTEAGPKAPRTGSLIPMYPFLYSVTSGWLASGWLRHMLTFPCLLPIALTSAAPAAAFTGVGRWW
jgi:hypothetical protein